jgi:ABC-2 type transport system permease protein
MTGAMVRLELRRTRSLVGGLVAIIVLYAGAIAAFYPTIRSNTAAVDAYMQAFPKGFLAAFGMTGSLSDPGVFYGTYIGSFLWPVAAAMVGIVLASRPVAADLDRGYLELTLATPVSRTRLLTVAIAGQVAAISVLAVVMIGSVLAGGAAVNAGFDAGRFLLPLPTTIAFGAAIAGPTTLASVITLSRGRSAGIAAGVLIVMYLIRILVGIQPDLGWLGGLSLFQYGDPGRIVASGTLPPGDTLVLTGIGVVGWVAAVVLFRRRDLAV